MASSSPSSGFPSLVGSAGRKKVAGRFLRDLCSLLTCLKALQPLQEALWASPQLQHSSAAGFLATGHVLLTPQSGDVTAVHHRYAAACAPRAAVHRAHRKWTTPLNLFRKRQTVLDRVTVLVVPRPGTVKQWPFLRRRASVTVPVERNRVFDLSSSSLTGMGFRHAPINFALATSRLACVPDYVVNHNLCEDS